MILDPCQNILDIKVPVVYDQTDCTLGVWLGLRVGLALSISAAGPCLWF